MQAPPAEKAAPAVEPAKVVKVSIKDVLSESARKLLGTLGYYQRQHFQDRQDARWWMQIHPQSLEWPTFVAGAPELIRAGLVVVEPPNWRTYLSPAGLAFCAANRDELDSEPRIDRFGPG